MALLRARKRSELLYRVIPSAIFTVDLDRRVTSWNDKAESLRSVQLASVGQLAAGVAHEINNPINGIINYAQIIQDEAVENQVMSCVTEKIIVTGEVVALDDREYVRVVLHDMGIGIFEETVDKIFEPFFSSKTQGEGTGLGLSISKEIVAMHGGFLHVESQENGYTGMIVDLPACEGHQKNISNNFSLGKVHD